MRIAIMNVVGEEGSTGKIATKLANRYISLGHECRIYHGRGKKCKDGIHFKHGLYIDNIIHYCLAKLTGKEGYYSSLFTKNIIKEVISYRPDRLMILNLHGHWLNVPLFLNEIAKLDICIDWFMCDEYPYTARCEYAFDCEKYTSFCHGCTRYKNIDTQYKDKEAYYKKILSRTVFSSLKYIVDRATTSSLLRNAQFTSKNTGIDTDFYHPVDGCSFKQKYKIADDKIVLLDVAPFSNKRKGVELFIEAARLMKNDDQFVFVNVGYDGKQSIELPNFLAIPYVSDQEELREIYSAADRYVCTSTADALPNACVEAMSCGTPITAFNVSGMPYLADFPVLTLVDSITAEGIKNSIERTEKKDNRVISICRKEAVEKYDFVKFADSFLSVVTEDTYNLINKENCK